MTCSTECRYHRVTPPAPPEPPVGTWVRDRFGSTHQHGLGGGWGTPGFFYTGKWEAMWEARGPLEVCGPWGASLTDSNPELWK